MIWKNFCDILFFADWDVFGTLGSILGRLMGFSAALAVTFWNDKCFLGGGGWNFDMGEDETPDVVYSLPIYSRNIDMNRWVIGNCG